MTTEWTAADELAARFDEALDPGLISHDGHVWQKDGSISYSDTIRAALRHMFPSISRDEFERAWGRFKRLRTFAPGTIDETAYYERKGL